MMVLCFVFDLCLTNCNTLSYVDSSSCLQGCKWDCSISLLAPEFMQCPLKCRISRWKHFIFPLSPLDSSTSATALCPGLLSATWRHMVGFSWLFSLVRRDVFSRLRLELSAPILSCGFCMFKVTIWCGEYFSNLHFDAYKGRRGNWACNLCTTNPVFVLCFLHVLRHFHHARGSTCSIIKPWHCCKHRWAPWYSHAVFSLQAIAHIAAFSLPFLMGVIILDLPLNSYIKYVGI